MSSSSSPPPPLLMSEYRMIDGAYTLVHPVVTHHTLTLPAVNIECEFMESYHGYVFTYSLFGYDIRNEVHYKEDGVIDWFKVSAYDDTYCRYQTYFIRDRRVTGTKFTATPIAVCPPLLRHTVFNNYPFIESILWTADAAYLKK